MHTPYWNLNLAFVLKNFLFNAGLPILLLFFVSFSIWKAKISLLSKRIFFFSFIFLTLSSYKNTPEFLLSFLLNKNEKEFEKTYSPNNPNSIVQIPTCIDDASAIVVLSGGISQTLAPQPYSLTRLQGLTVFLNKTENNHHWKTNKTPIIFSGGLTESNVSISEANVLNTYAKYLYGEKFSDFNIILEEKSKNTYQNAFYTAEIFQAYHIPKNILLLTNSFHMHRALKTFQAKGFVVCPVLVTSRDVYGRELFNFKNASKSALLFNEYFGIAGYLAKGWIR
jgi:uncharacterized SAM-binding protein YcdF (DUF218 family)